MNAFFVKILNKINCLKYLNVFCRAQVNEKNIYIPVLSGVGLENLPFTEIWMCDLIRYALSVRTGFFMDIGANVGQTLIKLRLVDEERPYVGFEPNSECVHYFNQLVKINKFKNIDLIPVGLYDRNAVLALNLYTQSPTDQGASLIENLREGKTYGKINVPVFEYRHIAEAHGLGKIAIIKIDVEGAELEVLTSIKCAIKENQPIIIVEILPAYDNEYRDRVERQNKISVLMKELGYEILRVHKNKSYQNVERLEKLAEFDIHGNIEHTDYVLIPSGLSENMLNKINKAV
jgi:FkbM family methyltransferase